MTTTIQTTKTYKTAANAASTKHPEHTHPAQTEDKCFACDRISKAVLETAFTSDGQIVWVGPECYRKIVKAGFAGYQPPKGGPRLFTT